MNDAPRGPIRMTADEVASFLGSAPTGAVCVDAGGRLRAVPARARGDAEAIDLELTEEAASLLRTHTTAGCVVVDSFGSYTEIRGVIAQGRVTATEHEARLDVARMTSFSFAKAMPPEPEGTACGSA